MRRSVTWAMAAILTVVGVTGCSGVSESQSASPSAVNPIGNPSDTASPEDTSRPISSEQAAVPTLAPQPVASAVAPGTVEPGTVEPGTVAPGTVSPGTVEPGAAALAACLDGNWRAPVSREFGALGVSQRSAGAVRSGTGWLRLTLGQDQSFTFVYDQVALRLAAGQAVVTGPVTGMWSLSGNTMRTMLTSRATRVRVSLGPVSVDAPRAVASAVENLPPGEFRVTCTNATLSMLLPTAQGGGTVTFDRA